MARNSLALLAAALACAAAAALLTARLRAPAVDTAGPPATELEPIASTIVTPLVSTPSYTNDELARRFQEETARMGISGLAKPEDEPTSDGSFLGERLGQPGTREQAEAYIRQFQQMRRPFERESEKSVKLPGDTAGLLGERPRGGEAISSSSAAPHHN